MTIETERLMSPAQEVAYLNATASVTRFEDCPEGPVLPTCPSCGCAVLADGDLRPPCATMPAPMPPHVLAAAPRHEPGCGAPAQHSSAVAGS
jgi:hypothetical protein